MPSTHSRCIMVHSTELHASACWTHSLTALWCILYMHYTACKHCVHSGALVSIACLDTYDCIAMYSACTAHLAALCRAGGEEMITHDNAFMRHPKALKRIKIHTRRPPPARRSQAPRQARRRSSPAGSGCRRCLGILKQGWNWRDDW